MNKEIERFYLDRFKANLPSFPQGEIRSNERPDFLITGAERMIGVEVTQFYRDRVGRAQYPLQQREAVRQKIISHAKAIADKHGSLPAYVFVHFDLNFHCRAFELPSIASKLVELAEGRLQNGKNEEFVRRDEIQIPGIAAFSLKRAKGSTSIWRAPLANFVPTVSSQQIQHILNEKTNRSNEYRKICDEIWLIIVIDRFRASSFAQIPEGIAERGYTHGFDSAFLFFYDYDATQRAPFSLRNKAPLVSESASK